ncbi:hypothetical protein [Methylorubrum sp. POS3]|uniref:hypothetical protein n=1 Tax=Methylorubrum sp. POS3 TaxID=2998492 RepID=UPI0037263CDE
MHQRASTEPPDTLSGSVEEIALSYLQTTEGDAGLALRCAISDALADLCEADRRSLQRDRLISRGYVRAALHEAVQ